jgi:hypothetical protein
MLVGPCALGLGERVSLPNEHSRRRGLPGTFWLSSLRGSGYKAPGMVVEMSADLIWEDAIITDSKSLQTVALGGEILLLC